jgi:VIT1/CCC1 family predicted Fe2+/Mn2+ transporter
MDAKATIPDPSPLHAEIREIFHQKGFEGELLDRVVEVITGNRQLWIETMLKEEWGLSLAEISPTRAAAVTFFAFIIVGMVPLLPFLVFDDGSLPFTLSIGMTAAVFFGIGALKARYVSESWIRAGLETLLMGGGAATLAYVVGVLLRGLAESSPGFVR